jgi:hypothetical protein
MLKYAKIEDEETKVCSVGTGDNAELYQSLGMTLMDVEKTSNGDWYVLGYAPEEPTPTEEQQKQKRSEAFSLEADPLRYNYDEDCARYGYDSEQAQASKELWLAKKDEIRQRYPYPEEA